MGLSDLAFKTNYFLGLEQINFAVNKMHGDTSINTQERDKVFFFAKISTAVLPRFDKCVVYSRSLRAFVWSRDL